MTLRTPYYLIDERRLQQNLEVVGRVRVDSGAKSVLALKCFSTWGVFGLMSRYLDGTTSSSLYEARLGREQFGKEVHAYSVAWDADEVAAVAEVADKVIFNSVSQLRAAPWRGRWPAGRAAGQPRHQPLALRSRRPGAQAFAPRRHRRRRAARRSPPTSAVSCSTSTARTRTSTPCATAVDLIADRYADVLDRMQWVSLGGGISFTTPGYPVERFCVDAARRRRPLRRAGVPRAGRGVRSPASAELVTTVLDVVHNEVDVAVVDASVEAHMLDHLIYGTHPRVERAGRRPSPVTIAGRTCLAGDVFGEYSLGAPLEVGDEVRFADAAGYTMVKTTWFNGLRDAVDRRPSPRRHRRGRPRVRVRRFQSAACRETRGAAHDKKNVLIIGAGGVAHVAAHKAAMHNDVLGDICIASRTLSKCEAIIDSVERKGHLKDASKQAARPPARRPRRRRHRRR